jgi:hypothetical protein
MLKGRCYNSNDRRIDAENCSVCRDLLVNLRQFFDMLETGRRTPKAVWLTVDDVATELKISKSIVYRLIRHGELEAVDIVTVDNDDEITRKGHYRVKRSSLNQYLESKKVRPFPKQSNRSRSRRIPKVKNHLGL